MSSSDLPTKHRALVATSDKTVQVREKELPTLSADDVLVQVKGVTLNPTDWKHVANLLKDGTSTGSDFAGVVVRPDEGGKWRKGDRVAGFTRGGYLDNANGAFSEYIKSPSALLWRVPEATGWEDAASMGGIGLSTAVYVVNYKLGLPRWNSPSKEPVPFLIWSGATSVGDFLVQLSKILNLKAYVTASPKHHERLRSLGAAEVFDYKDPEVASKIKQASGGKIQYGVDCISENGTTKTAAQAFRGDGGKLATLLPVKQEGEGWPSNVEIIHCLIYAALKKSNEGDHEVITSWNEDLPGFIESGRIKANPVVHRGEGLDKIGEGLEYLKSGKASGEKLGYTL